MGTAFPETAWSMILRAGEGHDKALEDLCERYWFPLYAFCRRSGNSEADSQDLVQGLLTSLLERGDLSQVDQVRGRFRSWLLETMKHHARGEWRKGQAQKRGGGIPTLSLDLQNAEGRFIHQPSHDVTPDVLFMQQWAMTLLAATMDNVAESYMGKRKLQFEVLKGTLTGDGTDGTYQKLGKQLGMSEGAVKVAVHRLRKRYRNALRTEVARTVDDPAAIEDELYTLFASL
jgi:RNA polymerase sigma-70 factor (ECF subfamily)